MTEKWRSLSLLALGQMFALALWFSASAVVPQLRGEWGLSGAQASWLTMSVQLGFVVGALASAALNLADRIAAQRLVALSAALGAGFNAAIALFVDAAWVAITLRFFTGMTLAGVYPPGMKLMATWCKEDRGLCIGLLVGAITVGSALPHLFNALPLYGGEAGIPPWRPVLMIASGSAALGAALCGFFVRPGPLHALAAPFDPRQAGRALGQRALRLANFGYFGHMWELYGMWTWAPLFLVTIYMRAGWSETGARLAGFGAVAIGGLGCVVAGRLADRFGRTRVTSASLLISGVCALTVGFMTRSPAAATAVCLIWGFAVVADSAQFSAAVSELADPRYVGTALTMQTSLGFLLTLFSIRIIPPLVERVGWEWAFAVLALGPVFGIVSMLRLRTLPESRAMASGHR
ncbi:MAG: MFS transporter [Gemmatimonadetes bacterium]|uniref:MFS transporter n=1 Tax=Candidatus Kutchimonas denitrificans TaxID=3056748 RepID=A0AAE4Z8R2_9BACT|nr:MFS transporter [Gemmatimonadota bacterium]NIR75088.1 MFS transporter [Candidatus Kutchimonas denitrificans]NIS00920.1 MFS transporter [Gemmatimonadota bacterium]NIT66537.1 MFS transporter [Gemmatimonadota bacterium]NIU52883.1 MFS transporter [Gemmatimonadota bacterium]